MDKCLFLLQGGAALVGIAVGHVHCGEQRGVVSCWVSWWRGEGAWWNNVAIKTWCKFGGLCPSAPTTSAPRAGGGELLGVEVGVPQVCKAFGSETPLGAKRACCSASFICPTCCKSGTSFNPYTCSYVHVGGELYLSIINYNVS